MDGPDEKKKVPVEVFAPRHPKPKDFDFPEKELVRTAATVAAEKFDYSPGLNVTFKELKTDRVLDRDVTLEAAGVHAHDKLELVCVGGGV
jgi:hypothetical protein